MKADKMDELVEKLESGKAVFLWTRSGLRVIERPTQLPLRLYHEYRRRLEALQASRKKREV